MATEFQEKPLKTHISFNSRLNFDSGGGGEFSGPDLIIQIALKFHLKIPDKCSMKKLFHVVYLCLIGCSFYLGSRSAITAPQNLGRQPSSEIQVLGHLEIISIGANKNFTVMAKVDSGAESASLHAYDIKIFTKNINDEKKKFVSFKTQDDSGNVFELSKELVKEDIIKSASGHSRRYFILETIWLSGFKYEVQINLADRSRLKRKFLIGKNVLVQGPFLIDVSKEMLAYKD